MPEPPIPSTTMLRIGSAFGNASACTAAAASCAAASCSGSPATAPRKFRESTLMVALATSSVRNPPRRRSPLRSRLFEVGLHAVGGGLRREPCVLRVVDGVGVGRGGRAPRRRGGVGGVGGGGGGGWPGRRGERLFLGRGLLSVSSSAK